MAKKYLPIRLNEELIKKVTEKAKKAKRSRNQYIEIFNRKCLFKAVLIWRHNIYIYVTLQKHDKNHVKKLLIKE